MKVELQYLNDANGKTQAIQMPLSDWEKIIGKLKKYEQALKIKSDLSEAFQEVSTLSESENKQTLTDFLNEL